MDQVRINRDFGELVIEYSTLEELKGKLDEIEKAAELDHDDEVIVRSWLQNMKPKGYKQRRAGI